MLGDRRRHVDPLRWRLVLFLRRANRDPATDGPILFVFDVSDTAPLPNARPLPPQVEDPFRVRDGKIGGQLALTIDMRSATACGSPSAPTVRSGPDPSNGPQPGSI